MSCVCPWGPLGSCKKYCWAQTAPAHIINVDPAYDRLSTFSPSPHNPFREDGRSHFEDEERKSEVWAAFSLLQGLCAVTVCLRRILGVPVPNGGSPHLPMPKPGQCPSQAMSLLLLS